MCWYLILINYINLHNVLKNFTVKLLLWNTKFNSINIAYFLKIKNLIL